MRRLRCFRRPVVSVLGPFLVWWCACFPGATVGPTVEAAGRDEIFIEHVDPPAVLRGGRTRLRLAGRRLDRATGLWTSAPSGKLRASVIGSEAGGAELEVETTADCPVGLYGLRLATEDGLSNLHLFAIDDIAPQVRLAEPQVEFPAAVAGVMSEEGAERHRIRAAAGETLTFDVLASRLGNDSDPLVTIYDASGRRLVWRDNDPALFFDCCFTHRFEAAGDYEIEVRDARRLGSPHWRYLLRIGRFPAARAALPSAFQIGAAATSLRLLDAEAARIDLPAPAERSEGVVYQALRRPGDSASAWIPLLASNLPQAVEQEPNDMPESATAAPAPPVMLHGAIDRPLDRDHFLFDLKKGDRLTIRGETRSLPSPADLELTWSDSTGRELQRADDQTLPGGALEEGVLNVNVGQDGVYRLTVKESTRSGGPEYGYRIEVRRGGPQLRIVSDVSAFSVPRESFQVAPLTVQRTEYDGPIQLTLVGAPPGLTLEPDLIPASVSTVCVKLKADSTAPLGLFSLSIVGRATAGEGAAATTIETLAAVQPLVDRQLVNVDLIKHALRDNQRHLPGSVRSQLAVQIVEPAPVQWEPAESTVILPRYLEAALPLALNRSAGFDGPLEVRAWSGGQLGEESQGRRQVFYRAIAGGPGVAPVVTFHSRSQANEGQERVDLYATAQIGARRTTLHRSVQLQIKPAVEPALEPNQLTLAPGGVAKLKLLARRLPSFNGPATVTVANLPAGIELPTTIALAAGQEFVELEVKVAADAKPRRERLRFTTTATVGSFQEEPRPAELDLEIKLPPAPEGKQP